MGRIGMLKPSIRAFDGRPVKPQEKRADPIYLTPEYRTWREAVIARAGRRCEAMVGGKRCPKREPGHRMFADHITEISDGGAPFDPDNGQCFCGGHHTFKTAQARAARLRGERGGSNI
jgi:5-methylcytosine-specific restriction enzyme A